MEELDLVYQYDAQLLDLAAQVSSAIDNVEASFGTDGLPAAIRHLVTLSQDSVDAFDRRDQIIVNMSADTAA